MFQNKACSTQMAHLLPQLFHYPHAMAEISGSEDYPEIKGRAYFLQTNEGVLMMVEVFGLPTSKLCEGGIFGFHIHEGWLCRGNEEDAFMIVLTDNFFVEEVVGRTIIVHSKVDDFTSQPAGNAGTKMACGQIRRMCSDR